MISLDAADPIEQSGTTVDVTRTYLQLPSRGDLIKVPQPAEPVRIEQATKCPPSFFRYLYAEVGRQYHWVDRLPWTDEEIAKHLARSEVSVWVMYTDGSPAGYFELEQHDDGSTEIAYFGLFGHCIGRGLGKYLLAEAVDKAWATGASRVWLHTCTLDDPAALPNYTRRGFQAYKQETYQTTLSPEELRWYELRTPKRP